MTDKEYMLTLALNLKCARRDDDGCVKFSGELMDELIAELTRRGEAV